MGVSRWQQKQAMVRDMYARNNSTPDMNHEQKVMYAPQPRRIERACARLSAAPRLTWLCVSWAMCVDGKKYRVEEVCVGEMDPKL